MSGNSAWRQTNSLGRVNEAREVAGGQRGRPGEIGRRVRPGLLRGERHERVEVVAVRHSDRTAQESICVHSGPPV